MDMMQQIIKEKGVKIYREFPPAQYLCCALLDTANEPANSSNAEDFLTTYATVSISRTLFNCVKQ
jgi:hypothetical protein